MMANGMLLVSASCLILLGETAALAAAVANGWSPAAATA
jgi:hypothetical protein